jgi:hypothetical protein
LRTSIKDYFLYIVFIIVVVVLYSVYNYLTHLEVPLWMIQFTFYAFMTAFFGFIFGILALLIRDHLEGRKMKKIEKKGTLESLKAEYDTCAWSIQNNIERYIEKNEMTDFVARLEARDDFGEEIEVPKQLKKQVQGYNEKSKDYNLFLRMSKHTINEVTEKRVLQMFPKTRKRSDGLSTLLNSGSFMERYLNGEKVTATWLKDTHPVILKNITKEIDETERHELDIYFNEINTMFEKEEVLQRFIKAKEELIKYGQETMKVLKKESEALDRQLQQYTHLRTLKTQGL